MANTGCKGINAFQTGTAIVFDAFLQSSAGAKVTTGTTTLTLYERQNDGTLKTYDFATTGSTPNQFVANNVTPTTPSVTMTHQTGNDAGTNTGIWTYALTTLTGFTAGAIYYYQVNNSGASPTDQCDRFQYGSAEGDLVTLGNGTTGQAWLEVDAEATKGTALGGIAGAANGLLLAGANAATTFATGSHFIGTVDTTTAITNSVTFNNVSIATVGAISGVTFPANFSLLAISLTGAVTVGTLPAGVFPTNFSSMVISLSGYVTTSNPFIVQPVTQVGVTVNETS